MKGRHLTGDVACGHLAGGAACRLLSSSPLPRLPSDFRRIFDELGAVIALLLLPLPLLSLLLLVQTSRLPSLGRLAELEGAPALRRNCFFLCCSLGRLRRNQRACCSYWISATPREHVSASIFYLMLMPALRTEVCQPILRGHATSEPGGGHDWII